jgi:hypothetical protein
MNLSFENKVALVTGAGAMPMGAEEPGTGTE